MLPWSKPSSGNNQHTYTPARQRALNRRSYGAVALAVVVVILALSQFGEDGLATFLKLRSHENELVTDVLQLQDDNAVKVEELDNLANKPSTLEELARQEHNMRHLHEEVLTVFPEIREDGNQE